jgi:hypothetical protein
MSGENRNTEWAF